MNDKIVEGFHVEVDRLSRAIAKKKAAMHDADTACCGSDPADKGNRCTCQEEYALELERLTSRHRAMKGVLAYVVREGTECALCGNDNTERLSRLIPSTLCVHCQNIVESQPNTIPRLALGRN